MTFDDLNDDEIPASAESWPNDGLDRLIAKAARDYNAPPPTVPRDAMWAAIAAARIPAAPDAAPAVVRSLDDARTARDARERRRTPKGAWWGLAAAAAIFLATGVGIGRWWGAPVVATTSGAPDATSAPTTGQVASAPQTVATPDSMVASQNDEAPDAPVRRTQVNRLPSPEPRVPTTNARAVSGTNAAYDVAVVNHFAKAEALLVSYRADTLSAALDTRLAKWVRPMLVDTRLLLDSPAADDPRRRQLLEDLELVLAQMARLDPADAAAADSTTTTRRERSERQLIDGAMRHAQLLPRLRTAVPAGS